MTTMSTTNDDYVLGRSVADSIRLDAQHLLWKLHTGYDLHPKIPIKGDMKIAELGTGTGIWIFDLANNVPSTVQLHGFDISDGQFPHEDHWPDNVRLGLLDSFVEPPSSLRGQYDVVHIRMWASNLRERDMGPLLHHTSLLLKPGGYVQWEDADLVNQVIKGVKAKEFEQMVNTLFPKCGIDYSWVARIPNHLNEARFNVINSESGAFKGHLAHLCTNTYLLALQEILGGLKRTNPPALAPLINSREEALNRLFAENKKGMVYNWSPVTVLAQKQ